MTLPRIPRALIAIALLSCLALVGLAGAHADGSHKRSSKWKIKACSTSKLKYPNKNPGGYFTSLRVRSTSCKNGRALARDWYSCRVRNGGRDGTCERSRVRKYKCKESRPKSSQSEEQLNAKVTCRRGKRGLIIHTYQQNLR